MNSQDDRKRAIPPSWRMPKGVTASLWEYAHDPAIALEDDAHLADCEVTRLDQRLLVEWLTPPARIVDLGCGPGRISIPLANRGFAVTGVDLSPTALAIVSEVAKGRGLDLPVIRGNLCELDFLRDESFDVALLMFGTLGMIRGAENRETVLRHAGRLLTSSGRLVLHVHSVWPHLFLAEARGWLARDLLKRLIRSESAGDTVHDYRGIPRVYHHCFTWRELRRLLTRAGFRVLRVAAVESSNATNPTSDPIPSVQGEQFDGSRSLRAVPRASGTSTQFRFPGLNWWRDLHATGWIVMAEKST